MKREYHEPTIFCKDGIAYKVIRPTPYQWICHWSPCPQIEPSTFECPNCGGDVDRWPKDFKFCPFCGEPIEMPDDK